MEDSRQSREHGMPLLVHRRKITADAAKSGDACRTAEGARNLLLNFCPAKVALGLVIRKRNAQVVEQRQDLIGTSKQGIEQILGLALFASAFALLSRRRRGWGLSSIASSQDLEVASDPVVALAGGNTGPLPQTPLLARIIQIEQEVLHLCGPLLMLLLGNSRTIAHEVGSTDAMSTVIAIITRQPVVHASACKARPDANLVHGRPTSRSMPRQMRQEASAVHMQPMQHPIHADAGFISMLQSADPDQLGNALDGGSQPLCCHFAPLQQGGFRDLTSTDRRERFAGASCGEQLSLVQIDGQRLQVGTILYGGGDRSRKATTAESATSGATDHFDLMVLGPQANFRHVEDLTAFCDGAWDPTELLMALRADLGTVTHDFIWLLHHRERVPRMPSLTSWTLCARTTRTARQTPKPIRRGRLTTRSTVLCQSVFELLDPGVRLDHLLFQRQQFRYQRFEGSIFFSKGLQFFFFCHDGTVTDFRSFGKSVGDLSSYLRSRIGCPCISLSCG